MQSIARNNPLYNDLNTLHGGVKGFKANVSVISMGYWTKATGLGGSFTQTFVPYSINVLEIDTH